MIRPSKMPDLSDLSNLTPIEQKALATAETFQKTGTAYAFEHGTRPSTIGLVLSSSPLALLAWIGEKFLEWSDTPSPSLDHILTNVSLYWFTQSFPRSIYPYRQMFGTARMEPEYIKKPLGFSFFPKELNPGLRRVVESSAEEVVFFGEHEGGGHFAALERPGELLGDVEEFVGRVWKV